MLAGGRSRRLGQDKATARVGGRRLVDIAVGAAHAAGCRHLVVVGPASLAPGLAAPVVTERPRFAGPVAALGAGLAALPASVDPVLVLACDLPRADQAVRAMLDHDLAQVDAAGSDDLDGRVLVDPDGRPQWLTGLYERGPLAAALAAVPTLVDASMRAVTANLRLARVTVPAQLCLDVDTPADLVAAEEL